MEQVAAMGRRHQMFVPGGLALAAVSGGPDSLCLLHAMARLRRLFGFRLACFHFDHRLRKASSSDAAYVRRHAAALRVPFVLRRADSAPGRGESIEAWARGARYRAISEVLEERGGGVAALGHTADDQAETILLALLRGGGLHALSGMSPVSKPIVRPLLETTREETLAFCSALRLHPRRDPMNEDTSFMRVAVRKRVIPQLEQALGRNVRPTLVRTASLLRQDAELLEELAAAEAGRIIVEGEDERLLRVEPLNGLSAALAGRVVRLALMEMAVAPEASHVESVLRLAYARGRSEVSLPGGLLACRDREYVRLSRPSPGQSAHPVSSDRD